MPGNDFLISGQWKGDAGAYQPWLARASSTGLVWSRPVEVGKSGSLWSLAPTGDGGYIATGYWENQQGKYHSLLIRLDSQGELRPGS